MTLTAWNKVTAERPAGGYVPIRADQLFAVWWCYEKGSIRLADVRVWFALHEVVGRRCLINPRRKPQFTTGELMELTGLRRQGTLRTSLRRLEELGLACSRRSSIRFATSVDNVGVVDRSEFQQRLNLIANHRRRVPVPRRLLRWLAAGSRSVLIATTLGHLLRLLYLRDGICRADGNCKASWVAAVFAINVRSVKQGRRRLIGSGLLQPQPMPQWYRNRYGWRGSVNLAWAVENSREPTSPSAKRTPPPRRSRFKQSPPRQDQKLSPRGSNQKPVPRRNGFCRRRSLGFVDLTELRDDRSVERILNHAVARRVVRSTDRLNVFAAAEHALRVGSRNPAGLFVWLVVNRRWDHVTQADEDAARRRLQRLDEPGVLLALNLRVERGRSELRLRTKEEANRGLAHAAAVLQQCLAA